MRCADIFRPTWQVLVRGSVLLALVLVITGCIGPRPDPVRVEWTPDKDTGGFYDPIAGAYHYRISGRLMVLNVSWASFEAILSGQPNCNGFPENEFPSSILDAKTRKFNADTNQKVVVHVDINLTGEAARDEKLSVWTTQHSDPGGKIGSGCGPVTASLRLPGP